MCECVFCCKFYTDVTLQMILYSFLQDQSNLRYELVGEAPGTYYFVIDPISGDIKVNRSIKYDRTMTYRVSSVFFF